MKSSLFVFLLSIAYTYTFAQEPAVNIFPLKDGKVTYEKVIKVDSASNPILIQRVKAWALSAFNSQKAALQTEEKDWIAYKGFINAPFTTPKYLKYSLTTNWQYWFTLRVYVKENRAKIIIDNVQVGSEDNSSTVPIETVRAQSEAAIKRKDKKYFDKYWKEVSSSFSDANLKINQLINSLSDALNTKVVQDF